jgi:hypothetical protein
VIRLGRQRQSPRSSHRLVDRLRISRDPARMLAQADMQLAEGRPDDAVDLLTAARRRSPDPEIEHRLLEARFQAFAQTTPPAQPPWPASVPDLFPGEKIPEIARRDLDAERLRSAITHHGSLIIRGFAEPAQVTRSVTNIERAFAAYDATTAERTEPDLAGWFAPFPHDRVSNRPLKRDAGTILAVDSPPAMCALIDTFEEADVGRLMRDYFGERPALLARKWSLRRVAHDARTGDWHQDGAFMGAGIRSLNIWLGLTHCGDTAPGIDVVGRRLDGIVETGTGGAHFSWSVGNSVAEAVGLGSIVRPIFDAGDAMIFDHLCLHRTAIDPGMTVDRHAIEAWFLAPSTYGVMLGPGAADDAPTDQIPLAY